MRLCFQKRSDFEELDYKNAGYTSSKYLRGTFTSAYILNKYV